jgi:putative transposase
MVFHVLNRCNDRRTIFQDEEDYAAFLRLFGQTQQSAPMRVLAYSVLSNHWHLVLWPEKDGQLGAFLQRHAEPKHFPQSQPERLSPY